MAAMISPSTTEYLIGTATLLVVTYIIKYYIERRQYPPGPIALPLIGNLHQIVKAGGILKFFGKNQKIYGNVFAITVSGEYKVVISGYDSIKLLLTKHASITCRRNVNAPAPATCKAIKERPGMVFSKNWKERRAECSKYLRNEGMGKSSLEPIILGEVHRFCDAFIECYLEKGLDRQQPLKMASVNMIYKMMMGTRMEYSDQRLHELVKLLEDTFFTNRMSALSKQIPFAAWIPGDPLLHCMSIKCHDKLQAFMDEIIASRREVLKTGQPPSLLPDHMLVKEPYGDETVESIYKNAGTTMQQLVIAGTDTMSTCINWAFLYMVVYKDMQQRVHDELDSVLESGETPSYGFKGKLPFTEAVILETLRHSVMSATTASHMLDQALTIEGKFIPANTELMFNLQSIYKDPTVFEDPEVFNPERFLVGDVKLKRSYTGMSFGIGRRSCLGEPLARMTTFLFFATIMSRYNVSYAGSEPPSFDGVHSLVNEPRPYEAVFTKRV